MSIESGPGIPESVNLHPELHSPFLELVDARVRAWEDERDPLAECSDDELDSWRREFQLVVEEQKAHFPTNLTTMERLVSQLEEYGRKNETPELDRAIKRLRRLFERFDQAVVDYADAAAFHQRTSQTVMQLEDGQQRLQTASNARNRAHVTIIDLLRTFRTAATKEFPQQLVGSEYRQALPSAVFDERALSTKGAARDNIGAWAIGMDIMLTAQQYQKAITAELDQREKN